MTIENLRPEQVQAISALLTEKDIRSAASKVGVSEQTLYVWIREDTFKQALQLCKRDALSLAMMQLQYNAQLATNTLVDILQSDKAGLPTKITAARTLLDFAFKAVEIEDIQERLATLEQQYEKSNAKQD